MKTRANNSFGKEKESLQSSLLQPKKYLSGTPEKQNDFLFDLTWNLVKKNINVEK